MAKYNGHPSKPAWNVALWINNDEGLYDLARRCVMVTKTRRQAAERMLSVLTSYGIKKTPDGYKYMITSIMNALVGYERE
jgi:hypothetical protein